MTNKIKINMFQLLPLFNNLEKIDGWLSFGEADLLVFTAISTCISLPPPHNIVEVGSYQGKSTVLLGHVVKSFSPNSKVHAIDPHEGVVSSAQNGLLSLPPTLANFNKNISDWGVRGWVDLINDYSFNVAWEGPISMLFIDGLLDYQSVSRDFYHFARFIRPGGFVAFHDYGGPYPGVAQLVNEVTGYGTYNFIDRTDNLVVLQKK